MYVDQLEDVLKNCTPKEKGVAAFFAEGIQVSFPGYLFYFDSYNVKKNGSVCSRLYE